VLHQQGFATPEELLEFAKVSPHPIPVNNFWSFMVYSGQHRSMLEADQKLAGPR
jgi:hypothetical protein